MLRFSLYFGSLLVVLLVGINFWIVFQTRDQIFHDLDQIPKRKVALILGTSKRTVEGGSNVYFRERVEAAAFLYKNGKVTHLIVSGDNRSVYYNEPRDMYNALIELGVPGRAITLDYAGLRTLDSIVRAKLVFGQDAITIITQDFHCYRALFIADFYEMDAVAYAAGDADHYPASLVLREMVARILAAVDLYIFQSTPRHLGEKELID